jgi:DNA-binding SARP family transcriptional activator
MTIVESAIERPVRAAGTGLCVGLLGGFQLSLGQGFPASVSGASQRLLAFLALRKRPLSRILVAETLWPDTSDARAHASLRSALARLPEPTRDAIVTTFSDIGLADGVEVDLDHARATAHRLLLQGAQFESADLDQAAIASLSADLLPDWYDDWAVIETEEWRQLRLHALEALAGHLVVAGRFGDAAAAAVAAVRAEPLRESAHAALVRVHLAEGNQSEALRAFARYRELLNGELGLEPTPRLWGLVRDLQYP